MVKKILSVTILAKICIFLLIVIGFFIFPFNVANYYVNFHYPQSAPVTLFTAFKTWDAQEYLYISEHGYQSHNDIDRFYPLFPFLIHVASPLFPDPLYAGLFVANMTFIIGIIYLYLFLKEYFKNNEKLIFDSIVLLLVFPTGFYFSLVYSESLCFCLTAMFFYYLYRKQFMTAGLLAFLLPLARPVGIFIIFPFTYYIITFALAQSKHIEHKSRLKYFVKTFLPLLLPVAGLGVYFLILQRTTGSAMSGFEAASHVVAKWQILNIFTPAIFLDNLIAPTNMILGFSNSLLDRFFFILYCFSLYGIYKKLDRTLFLYSLVIGAVPVFGSFMSYSRYLLLVFPFFMIGAIAFQAKHAKPFRMIIIVLLVLLQIFLLLSHSQNNWVA